MLGDIPTMNFHANPCSGSKVVPETRQKDMTKPVVVLQAPPPPQKKGGVMEIVSGRKIL